MICPKEEILLRFARGESDAGEQQEVEVHLNECQECFSFVAEHEVPQQEDEAFL